MESEFGMYFASFLRQRRKLMGLSQEEFAGLVHVSKSAITKWETGRGIPDRMNIRQLSKVLDVPIDSLNRICEGNDQLDYSSALLLEEIIALLETYGYQVTKIKER